MSGNRRKKYLDILGGEKLKGEKVSGTNANESDALMRKPGGGRRGGYSSDGEYDMELVEKILQVVESHHVRENIYPNLKSLRNTMLAASALLHLAHVEAYGQGGETFQNAAQECFNLIAASAVSIRQRQN